MTVESTALTVVVADDDADTREMLAIQLRGLAEVIGVAGTWDDAIEMLKAKQPDVLVTDERMPGNLASTGERLAAVRGASPATAVVMFCAAGDEAEAKAAGVSVFVSKPASGREIRAAVADAGRAAPLGS